MTKKKLVTCSPYKLLMGYEYDQKADRQIMNDRIRSKNYYKRNTKITCEQEYEKELFSCHY